MPGVRRLTEIASRLDKAGSGLHAYRAAGRPASSYGILLAIAIPTFLSVTKTATTPRRRPTCRTALTGADTYYTSNNQTYAGLYGGTGVSTITAIDTGLTYVSGSATTKSNTISVNTGGSGSWTVLAAYAPGTKDCWIIVDQKVAQAAGATLPHSQLCDWHLLRSDQERRCSVHRCERTRRDEFPNHRLPNRLTYSLHVGVRWVDSWWSTRIVRRDWRAAGGAHIWERGSGRAHNPGCPQVVEIA